MTDEEKVLMAKRQVDDIYVKVQDAVKDMSNEEIADLLVSVGLSAKGKREALIDKVVGAVMNGKLEFDDEESSESPENPPEEVDDLEEIFDFNRAEVTDERLNAVRELSKKLRQQIADEEISMDEVKKYLEYFYELNPEIDEQGFINYYVGCRCALIDDDGKENPVGVPYKINGKYACCGRFLEYNEETEEFGCRLCGNIYESDDEDDYSGVERKVKQ